MKDLYSDVTTQIIASLGNGVAPWVRPWNASAEHGGMPYNAISRKSYRGINTALLFAPHYPVAAWMTYKQATDVGAHVRKGERRSMIVFYKTFVVRDRNAPPDATGEAAERTIPLLRAFHVFNVAQIDNLPDKYLPQPDTRPEPERIAAAETLMQKATVRHGGDRAFYAPGPDFIQLPALADFRDVPDYYGTALHDLTHWRGIKTGSHANTASDLGLRPMHGKNLSPKWAPRFSVRIAASPESYNTRNTSPIGCKSSRATNAPTRWTPSGLAHGEYHTERH